MIGVASRPRLAAKARLRLDRKTDRTMILFPEKGIELSPSAAAIIRLCSGERTVAAIVDELAATYAAPDRSALEREVLEFLGAMRDRCLIEIAS